MMSRIGSGGRAPRFIARSIQSPLLRLPRCPVLRCRSLFLAQAGVLPHDESDQRLIREFQAGTGATGAPERRRDTPILPPAAGDPPPDQDRDGMPDVWETQHRLDPAAAADCWADPDQDGYGNLEEILNGTDPRRPEEAIERPTRSADPRSAGFVDRRRVMILLRSA